MTCAKSVLLPLLLVLAAACSEPAPPPARFPERPPVVLVIIDTLRADHLGFEGYELPTSPTLDALAAQSHRFSANTTQCNATFASITSVLTGLYPKTHRNYTAVPVEGVSSGNGEASTLAERLSAAGYYSAAVLSHPSMTQRMPGTAMDRGWAAFSTLPGYIPAEERRHVVGKADHTNERAFTQLERWKVEAPQKPLFLWTHYFDPHTPYDPPEAHRNRFLAEHLRQAGHPEYEAQLATLKPRGREREFFINEIEDEVVRKAVRLADGRALYDGEIRACDQELGRLFDRLRGEGLFDEALVIVLADHGENLEDESWGHGNINFSHQRLYEGVTRTPLLIKLPGQTVASHCTSLTQNIDLLPTVVELLGLEPEPVSEGRSLVPLLDDPDARVHEQVFVESSDHVEKGLRTAQLKYVDGLDPEPAVFAWADDPRETRELSGELPAATLHGLRESMKAFRPKNALGVRLLPEADDYTVSLEVRLGSAQLESALGASGLVSDGQQHRFEVSVSDEPVDVLLLLDRPMQRCEWRLSRTGAGSATVTGAYPGSIYLGRTPLAQTAAVPLWVERDASDPSDLGAVGAAPSSVRIERDNKQGRWSLAVDPARVGDVLVELQFDEGAPTGLRLTESQGFSLLKAGPSERIARLQGSAATGAERVQISWPAAKGRLLAAPLLDGRWPDSKDLLLNGTRVSTNEFSFVLQRDERLIGKLLASREGWDEPAGALVFYTTTSADQIAIDTSGMAAEDIEELRALGYVK